MESYLKSCQKVVMTEVMFFSYVMSDMREIIMGVPQRSVPTPIPFILYINRFPNTKTSAKHSMGMFADDTNNLVKYSCVNTAVIGSNNILKIVGDRFHNHNLVFNINQTQYIFFYTEES